MYVELYVVIKAYSNRELNVRQRGFCRKCVFWNKTLDSDTVLALVAG